MANQWVTKEYYIRPMGNYGGYQIAVFEGNKRPTNVYFVQGTYCSCPAGANADKSHKHIQLAEVFRRMGEPKMFVFWYGEHGVWCARNCAEGAVWESICA